LDEAMNELDSLRSEYETRIEEDTYQLEKRKKIADEMKERNRELMDDAKVIENLRHINVVDLTLDTLAVHD
jgi:hypothetical protein